MNTLKIISGSLLLSTFSCITMCSDSQPQCSALQCSSADTTIGTVVNFCITAGMGMGIGYVAGRMHNNTNTLQTIPPRNNSLSPSIDTTANRRRNPSNNGKECYICLIPQGPFIENLCINEHPNDRLCVPCVEKLDNCPQCREPLKKDTREAVVAVVTARNAVTTRACTIL